MPLAHAEPRKHGGKGAPDYPYGLKVTPDPKPYALNPTPQTLNPTL